jgi:hypothetical protein
MDFVAVQTACSRAAEQITTTLTKLQKAHKRCERALTTMDAMTKNIETEIETGDKPKRKRTKGNSVSPRRLRNGTINRRLRSNKRRRQQLQQQHWTQM